MMLRGATWCCVVLRGAAWCCVMLRDAACILCCTRFQVMYVVKEEGGEMRTYDKHEEGEGAPSRKRVTQEDGVLRCVALRCVALCCLRLRPTYPCTYLKWATSLLHSSPPT